MTGKVLTTNQKEIIWNYWKQGIAMIDISRILNIRTYSVKSLLFYHGGIKPYNRKRNTNHLSISEREEISRGLVNGLGIRELARNLNRSPSTICREIKRNGGTARYRAVKADKMAYRRARRPKEYLFLKYNELRELIKTKLKDYWSPQQISAWLKLTYPDNPKMQVSHETIYKSLYIQSRGLFRKEMKSYLRSRRKTRRAKNHKGGLRGQIPDMVSISQRPAEVEDRAIPGHWEGDLIQGGNNSFIATIVERQTRFVVLAKVTGKETETVVKAISKQMMKFPRLLRKSLTWDRGSELKAHKKFSMATDMDVYFCDPHSPWQRGSNENTNRLLRDFFPKKTDLGGYTQKQLNDVASRLNNRPRETLDFLSPAVKMNELLQ